MFKSTTVVQWQSHCFAFSIPRFDPQQDRNFSFLLVTGIRGDCGAESQSLHSVPNIPGLNTKFIHSAFDVKENMPLIVICVSDGDIKPDGPFGAFQ